MATTILERPAEFSASKLPIVYKLLRKDALWDGIVDSGGSVRFDVTGNFTSIWSVGDTLFVTGDNGFTSPYAFIIASMTYSAPSTQVVTQTAWSAAIEASLDPGVGYLNNETYKANYRFEVDIYKPDGSLLFDDTFNARSKVIVSPDQAGIAYVDVSGLIDAYLSAVNDNPFTANTYLDAETFVKFGCFIQPRSSAGDDTSVDDTANQYTAVLGALQIPTTYGNDLQEYLNDGTMKIEKTLTSAQILQLFTTPIDIVPAPGAGKYIDVIRATLTIDFITAAYATNINVDLQLNATSVLDAAFGILSQTSDAVMSKPGATSFGPINGATFTGIQNQALKAKVLTGNPTAGSGTLKITVIYNIVTVV